MRIQRIKKYRIFTASGIAVIDIDITDKEINGIKVVANQVTEMKYVYCEWINENVINLLYEELLACQFTEAFLKMGVTLHTTLAKT